MAHKTSGQLGFADAWLANNPKRNQRLDKLDRLSFCRFTGLSSSERSPDHSVFISKQLENLKK